MKRKNVNILAALLHVVDTSNHLFDVGLNFLTQPFFYIYFYYFIIFVLTLPLPKGWSFYGPNGGYSFLGGRDASRALAKMSLNVSEVENPHIDDLTETENKTLDDWIAKLSLKYPTVGKVKA